MAAGSVSRVRLMLELKNKGSCECEVARHLAPLTVGTLLRSIPIEGRVHIYENKFIYFETGLSIGAEKLRTGFKKGEMAFMSSNGSICIFLTDTNISLNPIGKIVAGLENIESAKVGDVLVLRSIEKFV